MCGGSVRAMLALYRSRSKGFAMFRKIIWATDGSEAADRALPYVKEVAASSGSAVVVCHSVLALLGPRAGGVPVLAGEDDIESKIRGQVDALTDSGIEASLSASPPSRAADAGTARTRGYSSAIQPPRNRALLGSDSPRYRRSRRRVAARP